MAALALGAGTVRMDAQAPETNRLFATANALYAEQRYAEAVDVYRAVLSAAGPEQVVLLKRTLQFLAALHGADKLNRPDEAEAVVRQLVALDPSDVSSYFGLARIYEEAGRVADAEAVLLQAQAAAPEQAAVWSHDGAVLQPAGPLRRGNDGVRAPDAAGSRRPGAVLPDGGLLRGEGPEGLRGSGARSRPIT